MGHTYRETHPEEATEHDRRIERIMTLRKRLEHLPSSEFTVIELIAVLRIMNDRIFTFKGRWQDPTEKALKRIERKLDDLMSGP